MLFDERKYDESEKQIQAIFKILIPNYNSKNILPNQNQLYAETVLIDAFDLQSELFFKQNQPKKALEAFESFFLYRRFIDEWFGL